MEEVCAFQRTARKWKTDLINTRLAGVKKWRWTTQCLLRVSNSAVGGRGQTLETHRHMQPLKDFQITWYMHTDIKIFSHQTQTLMHATGPGPRPPRGTPYTLQSLDSDPSAAVNLQQPQQPHPILHKSSGQNCVLRETLCWILLQENCLLHANSIVSLRLQGTSSFCPRVSGFTVSFAFLPVSQFWRSWQSIKSKVNNAGEHPITQSQRALSNKGEILVTMRDRGGVEVGRRGWGPREGGRQKEWVNIHPFIPSFLQKLSADPFLPALE